MRTANPRGEKAEVDEEVGGGEGGGSREEKAGEGEGERQEKGGYPVEKGGDI